MKPLFFRRIPEEIERSRRIRIAVWAYAYEVKDNPLATDTDFDYLAASIRPERSTHNEVMDKFFRNHFSPHTGQWIHKHPNLTGIRRIYTILSR